jgi:hypothetical protein
MHSPPMPAVALIQYGNTQMFRVLHILSYATHRPLAVDTASRRPGTWYSERGRGPNSPPDPCGYCDPVFPAAESYTHAFKTADWYP